MTRGVLLLGDSGSGKSLFALSILYDGGRLVSDDVVEVFRRGDDLFGRAPGSMGAGGSGGELGGDGELGEGGQLGSGGQLKETRGLLEVRGVGIVDIGRVLGPSFVIDESKIDLVVRLGSSKRSPGADGDSERNCGGLGVGVGGSELLGVSLPEISFSETIDPKRLVTAITDFILCGSQNSAVLKVLLGNNG